MKPWMKRVDSKRDGGNAPVALRLAHGGRILSDSPRVVARMFMFVSYAAKSWAIQLVDAVAVS